MSYAESSSNGNAYHTPESVRQAELPDGYVEWTPLLDKRSEPHPILSMLMDEALRGIMLVSDGSVMRWPTPRTESTGLGATADNPSSKRKRHRTSQAPTSDLASLIDDLGERFLTCKTHRGRLTVIREAQTVVVRLRYAPNRPPVQGTKEWREGIAHDPRDTGTVMIDYGITLRSIQRMRKEFGTNRPRGRSPKTTEVARLR